MNPTQEYLLSLSRSRDGEAAASVESGGKATRAGKHIAGCRVTAFLILLIGFLSAYYVVSSYHAARTTAYLMTVQSFTTARDMLSASGWSSGSEVRYLELANIDFRLYQSLMLSRCGYIGSPPECESPEFVQSHLLGYSGRQFAQIVQKARRLDVADNKVPGGAGVFCSFVVFRGDGSEKISLAVPNSVWGTFELTVPRSAVYYVRPSRTCRWLSYGVIEHGFVLVDLTKSLGDWVVMLPLSIWDPVGFPKSTLAPDVLLDSGMLNGLSEPQRLLWLGEARRFSPFSFVSDHEYGILATAFAETRVQRTREEIREAISAALPRTPSAPDAFRLQLRWMDWALMVPGILLVLSLAFFYHAKRLSPSGFDRENDSWLVLDATGVVEKIAAFAVCLGMLLTPLIVGLQVSLHLFLPRKRPFFKFVPDEELFFREEFRGLLSAGKGWDIGFYATWVVLLVSMVLIALGLHKAILTARSMREHNV